MDQETKLLLAALEYEQGHSRRTQHILKVYALAKALGEAAGLELEKRRILQAAAILHDIPIKYCKEHYQGDAGQENQRREAPALTAMFLKQSGYPESFQEPVLELVLKHHCYGEARDQSLQLLMEADLMINFYEKENISAQEWRWAETMFQSDMGKKLFQLEMKANTCLTSGCSGAYPPEQAQSPSAHSERSSHQSEMQSADR